MESLIEYSKVEVMRNEHVALRDVDFSVAPVNLYTFSAVSAAARHH